MRVGVESLILGINKGCGVLKSDFWSLKAICLFTVAAFWRPRWFFRRSRWLLKIKIKMGFFKIEGRFLRLWVYSSIYRWFFEDPGQTFWSSGRFLRSRWVFLHYSTLSPTLLFVFCQPLSIFVGELLNFSINLLLSTKDQSQDKEKAQPFTLYRSRKIKVPTTTYSLSNSLTKYKVYNHPHP